MSITFPWRSASGLELCSILRLDDDIHVAIEHVQKRDELIQALA
jgi:hypothetical protein